MRTALIIILSLKSAILFAQELIPVGTWRTHFNYEHTLEVELVGQRVFASTPVSLVYYDPSDNSLNTFSKVDGLSDVGLSAMSYDAASGFLAIGYQNGNLDLVGGNEIINIPILKNTELIYSKEVADISFYDETVNLALEFGVVVIDPNSGEVVESYQNLGPNGEVVSVQNSVFLSDLMFLATSRGVLMGDRSSGDNLQDFNNWDRFEGSGIFNRAAVGVANFEETIFAGLATDVFFLDGSEWIQYGPFLDLGDNITRLETVSDGILVLTDQSKIYHLDGDGGSRRIDLPVDDLPNDVIEMDGTYWYADNMNGLTQWTNDQALRYVLNGPQVGISKLKYSGETTFAFPEEDRAISGSVSNGEGDSVFMEGSWQQIDPIDLEGLDNLTDVAHFGDDPFFSSLGQGVFDQSQAMVFDDSNSSLVVHDPNTGNILVTGMDDHEGTLWLSSPGPYPIHGYKMDGTWERFQLNSTIYEEPNGIQVYRNGDFWLPLGINTKRGLAAIDGETFNSRHITSSNSSLPSNTVNDIAFDRDGEVWIATAAGIGYFPTGFGVIDDSSFDMIIPRFDEGFLFQGEDVRAVQIDAGNRKWMATGDGAWLFEESLQDLKYHFNQDNSPLPSNDVLDIAIDHLTGEVFFATSLGVVSFRSDAVSGAATHGQVKIFPNPVLPNYQDQVGIHGLARNATLKITTVSGRLVREIRAAGGGASWDISDYNGRRVNGGVYMVFSSSPDGEDTFVGKIAVLD